MYKPTVCDVIVQVGAFAAYSVGFAACVAYATASLLIKPRK